MTLETIKSIFAGNTKPAKEVRNQPVYIRLENYGQNPMFKVVNVTLTVDGHPVMIVEPM